jgi:hypothetical protein
MFAVATFLLDGPVTRSIGEVPWLVCVVVIGTIVTYLGGALRHAA